MILEVADIHIAPGKQAEFDEAIERAITTILRLAKGFRSIEVRRGLESPERYLLLILWDTLEDHTVGFRQSDLFAAWRAIIGPFFVEPARVEHFNEVVSVP